MVVCGLQLIGILVEDKYEGQLLGGQDSINEVFEADVIVVQLLAIIIILEIEYDGDNQKQLTLYTL